jgi:hypothetical protein
MGLLLWGALVLATVYGGGWLVEHWLGEDRRFWVALAGFGALGLGSALAHASGIGLLTRALRGLLIGGLVQQYGPDWPWLRRLLRLWGIETEPDRQTPDALERSGLRWSGASYTLLMVGTGLAMVGLGLVWVGLNGA